MGVLASRARNDPPSFAAAERVAVITTPRRLFPTTGDVVEEAEGAGVGAAMPRLDRATDSAAAAGDVTVRPEAEVSPAAAADLAGWLTAPVVRWVWVRLRAFGPALAELDLAALADWPASELPVSA
ncbi:hypothetical protein MSAR_21560 [Mycolicibacterium sarraceniae]|uniref:Uncharacterized protein n=1 Tax=Mycolicibacterium sarraceniae TaxID=1534348 RepID=A0A7I7SR07_9MYCO|nr:hypothetical protein MSAR_21560 [Mycolicibacterium sarraceniae]